MDYEKKYKEALDRARKKYNSKNHPSEGPSGVYLNNADLEEIFPELRESEDERIRKSLVTYFQRFPYDSIEKFGTNAKEALAYLEKQKAKEKYDRMAPIYSNQESFEDALENAWKFYNDSGSSTVDGCEDNPIELSFAKGFREGFLCKEKQKGNIQAKVEQRMRYLWDKLPDALRVEEGNCTPEEWKALGAYMELEMNFDRGSKEEQPEQKPSTEETELNSLAFLEQLEYTCIPPGAQESASKPAECIEDSVKFEEGFKAGRESGLRDGQKYVLDNLDSYGLCKPVEWSEEDKKVWQEIFDLCNRFGYDDACRKLKSLRHDSYKNCNSRWKPSEKQIQTLLNVITGFIPDPDGAMTEEDVKELDSLYYDLKKL